MYAIHSQRWAHAGAQDGKHLRGMCWWWRQLCRRCLRCCLQLLHPLPRDTCNPIPPSPPAELPHQQWWPAHHPRLCQSALCPPLSPRWVPPPAGHPGRGPPAQLPRQTRPRCSWAPERRHPAPVQRVCGCVWCVVIRGEWVCGEGGGVNVY